MCLAKALNFVKNNTKSIDFKIKEAKNCDSAYQKIKNDSYNFDLVFLDIQLPKSSDNSILSGESLGFKIRELHSKTKIIVCTNLNDNFRLFNILKTLNPDGFLVKSDIGFNDIIISINKVLANKTFYSQSITNLVRNRATNKITLDDYDIRILYEISNGARMKDILEVIPLSKACIGNRKRKIKNSFKLKTNTDRELVLAARKKGFI